MRYSYGYLQNVRQKAKGPFVAEVRNIGRVWLVLSGMVVLVARKQCPVSYSPSHLVLVALDPIPYGRERGGEGSEGAYPPRKDAEPILVPASAAFAAMLTVF